MTTDQHDSKTEGRGDDLARQERMAEDFERLVKIIEAWRTSSHTARWIAQRINEAGLLASPSDLPAREAIERAAKIAQDFADAREKEYDSTPKGPETKQLADRLITQASCAAKIASAIRALQPLSQGNGEAVAWQDDRKLSEEAQRQLEEIDRAIVRPGDPRMNTIVGATPRSQPEGAREALEEQNSSTYGAFRMTEEQIKYMVDRFLSWRLPHNFYPDNGISYTRPNYDKSIDATPSGTNLFDALQADEMVRHMVDGLPSRGLVEAAEVLPVLKTCYEKGPWGREFADKILQVVRKCEAALLSAKGGAG